MPEEERVVYLEDIQQTSSANAVEGQPQPSPVNEKVETKAAVSVTAKKRQLTLMDVMGTSSQDGGKSAKKTRLPTTVTGGRTASASSADVPRKLNFIPFSLSSFKESLTEEQARLLRLEIEVMGLSWLKLLKDEIKKPYFLALKRFLWEEGVRGAEDTPKSVKVYPAAKNIYAWSETPLGIVKVVILGQDPYHGPGQAHGLCFSVPVGVAVPPSLRNIYAEIKAEYPNFEPPKHGNLTAWANNGVLMLNTCLSVRAGEAGSHSNKGWEEFTDKVIEVVDKYGGANLTSRLGGSESTGFGRGVVFLAWGAWAAKRVAKLSKAKHLILKSAHPSPLSANKGFLGNGHFKAANDWLSQKYGNGGTVDWCNLDVPKQ